MPAAVQRKSGVHMFRRAVLTYFSKYKRSDVSEGLQ